MTKLLPWGIHLAEVNGQCFLALRCFLKFKFSSRNSLNSWAESEHRDQNTMGYYFRNAEHPPVLSFSSCYSQVQPATLPQRSPPALWSPFALVRPLPCHNSAPAPCLPSASRGLQCPEGSQGIGDEALKAYCTRTLPSTHRSHADPTSLGGQENRKTHHLSNSWMSCLFNYIKNSKI